MDIQIDLEHIAKTFHSMYVNNAQVFVMCLPTYSKKDAGYEQIHAAERKFLDRAKERFEALIVPWDNLTDGQKAIFFNYAKWAIGQPVIDNIDDWSWVTK